ncbi:MAG: 3-keto-5-aminohexanoate cleavage protein [Defluviitaleaceae bacterium]|nr:3-keto-5-aminohexanoate cleavage protein [Defluviitaleaceae bacterium]
MEKLIITAAISGAEVMKEHNPAVPYTIEEIGREALSAYNAGASIIHLHARQDDGTPTQDEKRFAQCIAEIKRLCSDVIIQPSTGGAVGMSNDERLQPVNLKPEMATLSLGTVNFGGDDVFTNTETAIKAFIERFAQKDVKPEFEIFDKGMLDTAHRLIRQGLIQTPAHFNFVMGVNGGIGTSIRDFAYLVDSLPQNATFTVAGIGRAEFPLAALAIIQGGHVRVGFEDNVYLSRGVLAKSNGELVEKVVHIAKELGREIATPNEARQILKLEA